MSLVDVGWMGGRVDGWVDVNSCILNQMEVFSY